MLSQRLKVLQTAAEPIRATDKCVVLTPEQQQALEEICMQNDLDCQFEPNIPQDWSDITMGDVADSGETDEAHEFKALAREIMGDYAGL